MSKSQREVLRHDHLLTKVNCETHSGFLEVAVMAMHVKTHHRNSLQARLTQWQIKTRADIAGDLPQRGQRSIQLSFEI